MGEDQLHLVQVEELLVLLDDRVLRLGQDPDQRILVQRLEHDGDRQATDELGDQAKLQQVVGDHLRLGLAWLLSAASGALEAQPTWCCPGASRRSCPAPRRRRRR